MVPSLQDLGHKAISSLSSPAMSSSWAPSLHGLVVATGFEADWPHPEDL